MAKHSYAAAYWDTDSLSKTRTEILKLGFEEDRFLKDGLEFPVYGLNVTLTWPLPNCFRSSYEDLKSQLALLDDGLYLYPFEQTHITLVTAVHFQAQLNPPPDKVHEIHTASEMLGNFIAAATQETRPFTIHIGPPVIARKAAFLPILNPTQEIARLRQQVLTFCQSSMGILAQASAPQFIHSTILRFRKPPRNPSGFIDAFEAIAPNYQLGNTVISDVLITLETCPYLRRGNIAQTISLRSK